MFFFKKEILLVWPECLKELLFHEPVHLYYIYMHGVPPYQNQSRLATASNRKHLLTFRKTGGIFYLIPQSEIQWF